jgi:transposase
MNRKNKKYHNELDLNSDLIEIMFVLLRRNSTTIAEHRRIQIIMHYHDSNDSFKDAAKKLILSSETVSFWYNRGQIINSEWERMLRNTLKETGHAGDKLRKERLLKELVADRARCGTPGTYTVKQYTDIVKIALQKPSKYNRPITHWTARELTDEVKKQQIAGDISQRQIQRFLKQADLKPHKATYWLNPKIDSKEEYEQQVKELCEIYHNAEKLNAKGVQIVSTDEKTGMQALERIHPNKPMIPGKEELIEAEYKRHGTLCLMPSFNVATGKIVEYYIGETRTEIDFADHIKKRLRQNLSVHGFL